MWPFDDKKTIEQAEALPKPQEELGDITDLNKLNAVVEDSIRKHLDPSSLAALEDTGGHFGTEFNLDATVGRLKSLYVREPWVYATASLIARTMSSVPFVVRDVTTGEIDPTHPLNATLEAGNKLNDVNSVNWAGYTDLSLGGNFFRILSDDYQSVWHAPVEFTEIVVSEAFKQGDMTADPIKELRITGGNAASHTKPISIPWKQVIHHKMPNPYNPFFGLSLYAAASRPILLDRHKNEFEMAFYLRGGTNSGVIETTEEISKKRMERLMRTFEQSYTGRRNWWRTLFLPKNSKWISNGFSMQEMDHLDGLRENRRTLLATLGIPPAMVGIVEDVNRSTAEIQEAAFWHNTIIPMSAFVAAGYNNSYLVKTVYKGLVKVEPDFSGIRAVEGSIITKGEQTEAAKDALTVNEIRTDIWGYKPLKGTDPRGNMFISQIRSVNAALATFGSGEGLGPEEGDEPIQPIEDEEEEQATKALQAKLKNAKSDAVTDQDRLERIQSEKYLREFTKYLQLLIDQTVDALNDERDVKATLEFLVQERADLYGATSIPVLWNTVERSFVVSASNSKFFNQYKIKAPVFTPTDEQALEILKERTEEGQRILLEQRSLERFYGFDETASEEILVEIEKGLEAGKTFQEIAKTIENEFGEKYRDQAFTITRTEVLSAASQGMRWEQEAMAELFSEVEKQWFHVGDVGENPDARNWHLDFEIEGKKNIEHQYTSSETGAKLKFPRDPSGGAKEIINCRCTMVTTVAEGATSNAVNIIEGS